MEHKGLSFVFLLPEIQFGLMRCLKKVQGPVSDWKGKTKHSKILTFLHSEFYELSIILMHSPEYICDFFHQKKVRNQ